MTKRLRILFTRAFWLDTAERSIKSAAQGAVAACGQDLFGADVFHAGLVNVASAGLALALLSVLSSVASAPVGGMSPASIVPPGA